VLADRVSGWRRRLIAGTFVVVALSVAAVGRSAIQPTMAPAAYLDPPGPLATPVQACPAPAPARAPRMPAPRAVTRKIVFTQGWAPSGQPVASDPPPAGVQPSMSPQAAWAAFARPFVTPGSGRGLLAFGSLEPSAGGLPASPVTTPVLVWLWYQPGDGSGPCASQGWLSAVDDATGGRLGAGPGWIIDMPWSIASATRALP
jgi:hypothetical protein